MFSSEQASLSFSSEQASLMFSSEQTSLSFSSEQAGFILLLGFSSEQASSYVTVQVVYVDCNPICVVEWLSFADLKINISRL